MIFPKTKKQITQVILETLPRGPYHSMPIDNVIFDWWLTGRGGQGLRLSDPGLKEFENARIEFYDFPLGLLPSKGSKKRIIAPESFVQELIKKISCPYYLGMRKGSGPFIRVYDHKTAMMITLHGTLRDYLDATKI
tara:strand:- start:546 stop:953 length:408 start_codon:yes stop_codon:yes gene_type:complete